MNHECEDCTEDTLCEHHEYEEEQAKLDQEFDEKWELGYR